jgi:hypothetical protein
MITYQEWADSPQKIPLMLKSIDEYRSSGAFRRALAAECYFRGENPEIARKTVLKATKIETRDEHGRHHVRSGVADVVGNRIGSSFLYRFICQENQMLLQSGCLLPAEIKRRLGADFDRQLEALGERALVQGVCWGLWDNGHLEVIPQAKDALSGFLPIMDEMTGRIRVGVQFWQSDIRRDLFVRLFEEDGVTVYRVRNRSAETEFPKRDYRITQCRDALGESICREGNWGRLPLIPLLANGEGRSELTPSIKAKIDAYDRILSDFADNLDRANDVYWVLNNFGGTTEDIAELLAEINRLKAVASISDGSGSASAEPRTIEVPYQARQTALSILEKELYMDAMALDTEALTAGSLTNVAIRAASANLNLKCDRYEWQLNRFVQELLSLLGMETEKIRFQRQQIANDAETVETIYKMRGDIDRATALRLNPLLQPEEVEGLLKAE